MVDKSTLKKAIKSELYHSWHGVIDGECGGTALDWKKVFYNSLKYEVLIKFTKLGEFLYN